MPSEAETLYNAGARALALDLLGVTVTIDHVEGDQDTPSGYVDVGSQDGEQADGSVWVSGDDLTRTPKEGSVVTISATGNRPWRVVSSINGHDGVVEIRLQRMQPSR